jgi:hypothetical protein
MAPNIRGCTVGRAVLLLRVYPDMSA